MTLQATPLPNWFSPPSDAIRYLMRRRSIPASELALHLPDGTNTLRGLLGGTVHIDSELAITLADVLGGTRGFWTTRQRKFDLALERVVNKMSAIEQDEWLSRIPAPGAKPRGRLGRERRLSELRRRLLFYNVCNIRSWENRYSYYRATTQYRQSNAFPSDDGAVSLWLRQGELESDMVATQPWNAENLRDRIDAIRTLSKIGRPIRFLPKLRSLLAEAGVALVVVPCPRGCPVSGASKLTSPDHAMILLSFRYRTDDQFWFTLFHEVGHLLLHGGTSFVDDNIGHHDELFEVEANDFASSCIIPTRNREEFNNLTLEYRSVLRFSVSINISPGLTVGQLQHHGRISFGRLNRLKRRWTWDEIGPALR